MNEITIHVEETTKRNGQFHAKVDGKELCISHQPFLDAARILLDQGHDPKTRIVMWSAGGPSLRSTIEMAAKLRVKHTVDGAPVFRKWEDTAEIRKRMGADE